MLVDFQLGASSNWVRVKIRSSTSPYGGATGLTFSTSGLRIAAIANNEATTTAYTAAGSTIETIATLGTFAAPTSTKCRFKEVDATNHPGVYEIQLDNTRFGVTNAKSLLISVTGTGLADCDVTIPLLGYNPYNGTNLNLSCLPSASPSTTGGFVLYGSGLNQFLPVSGSVTVGTNNDKTGYSLSQSFPSNFASLAIDVSGKVTVGTNSDKTGYSLTQSFPTNFASLAITVGGAVTAGTVSDKTGYSLSVTPPTAAQISTQVWSEAIPGSFTTGTAGYTLGNVATGSPPSASTIAAAVWNEAKASHTTAGTYGYLLDAQSSTLSTASALSSVASNVATILGQTGTTGVVVASGSKTGYTLSSAGLDSIVIETGVNARQALSPILAAAAGVLSGAGTGTIVIKAGANSGTTRVTATTDSSGNRSSVTLSLPS